jgi:hypothetical protein
MDKLRQLAPWQIILGAIVIVLLFMVGGYFLVTALTSTPPPESVTSEIPENLDSKKNQVVIKQLDSFNQTNNLPILTEPLRTPDPNSPSSVNPFGN